MPYGPERPDDRKFLEQAISISRHALEDEGKTPFGALVRLKKAHWQTADYGHDHRFPQGESDEQAPGGDATPAPGMHT
ncbi:hypothetical protein [Streptomyces beihaiensis]|uniref:Uncharacterized protein n=1 Tax=Streptomyces beihaiensis TaxID=2984495 RepID=A0ABT3U2V2_9ACTN|nr:hypothetical protein [Streptomyces beihaiensis]MCX3063641.1 hypothetical protein [Streptomyces beihaiensis]